jgi:hypothetical protein
MRHEIQLLGGKLKTIIFFEIGHGYFPTGYPIAFKLTKLA